MPKDIESNDRDLKARFKQLPKVVQDAILSADVEAHMRQLAEHHSLHLDQWTALENEVMFALLGFEPVENLAQNIEKQIDVPHETAVVMAEDISHIVFEPVRAALEQGLAAQTAAKPPPPTTPTVVPGTPPVPPPESKAVRAPISESYSAGQASHERRVVEGDPYREQPV